MKLVSVIIPCAHSNHLILKRAIESVLSQSYADTQIIVCFDNSSIDECWIKNNINYSLNQIKTIRHKTQKGISVSRNSAVNIADGEWLVWLDADDTLEEKCIEHLISVSQNHNMVLGNCEVIEKDSVIIRDLEKYIKDAKLSWKTTNDPFLHNITSLQPELVSKKAFCSLGGFNMEFPYAEMTEFFLRFISKFGIESITHSRRAIYQYYRNKESHSQKHRELLELYRIKALKEYAKLMNYEVKNIEYDKRNKDGMQHYNITI